MNRLPLEKQIQIISLLVEGNSLRSTSRITGTSINTVTKLLVDAGRACQEFHNKTVKEITSKRVQCDEIWSFVYAKQKNAPQNMEGVGDIWTWTAIDADTKLIIGWLVGQRDAECAYWFMKDVAARLKSRVQLTTDGLHTYLEAVGEAFGSRIDFAQLIKIYGQPSGENNERRYSPAECTGARIKKISGSPDERHVSTSYVERQNLTMRMSMRRFTRLTNAFSKKLENHCHAIALHFVYYNFCRIHKTLRVTPAMEAGMTDDIMSIEDVLRLTYERKTAEAV
jgi:IS1 family transposase